MPTARRFCWPTARALAYAAALVAALAACGCGRDTETAPGPAAGQLAVPAVQHELPPELADPALPSLAQLLEQSGAGARRLGSYVEADLLKNGDSMLSSPAAWHAEPTIDNNGLFYPDAQQGDPLTIGTGSWAIYRFDAPDYDRGGLVRLAWIDLLPPAQAYIALSNWGTQRWDWYSGTSSFDTGNLRPYFDASGTLFLTVYVPSAADDYSLDTIRLGGTPPSAGLTATPVNVITGTEVNFDASASTAGEGSIDSYRWDFDGDGSVDRTTTVPTTSYAYDNEGFYNAQVQVINSALEIAADTLQIRVINYWSHTLGLAGGEVLYDVVSAPDGNLYFTGLASDPGAPGTGRLILGRISPFGELEWVRYYTSLFCYGQRVRIDADGNLRVGGNLDTPQGRRMLIQKWSTEGALLWSKIYDSAASFSQELHDLELNGNTACVCGYLDISGDNSNRDLMIATVDGNGNGGWCYRQDDVGHYDELNDLSLIYGPLFSPTGIAAYGTSSNGTDQWPALILSDLNGGNVDFRTLDLDASATGDALIYYRPFFGGGNPRFYVAGSYKGTTNNVYFLAMSTDVFGLSEFGGRAACGAVQLFGLQGGVNGGFMLSGLSFSGGWQGYLMRFNTASGLPEYVDNYSSAAPGGMNLLGQRTYGSGLLCWGYAPSTSDLAVAGGPVTAQGLSGQWADNGGNSALVTMAETDSNGDVSDGTGSLTLDSGAGQDDLYIQYRAQP